MTLYNKGMEYLIGLGHTRQSAQSLLETLIVDQTYKEIENIWEYDSDELPIFSILEMVLTYYSVTYICS